MGKADAQSAKFATTKEEKKEGREEEKEREREGGECLSFTPQMSKSQQHL